MKKQGQWIRQIVQKIAGNSDELWEKTLERCFENTFFAIAVMDRDFNFIRVNKKYAELDNRDVSEFPGKNHFYFYPSDAKPIFEKVVATKQPYQAHARPFTYARNPERGITYWDWTLEPMTGASGDVELLLLTLNNVTSRVMMEKELTRLDRLNLVGHLAGGLGHEIRNPMTTVRGFLQIMSEKKAYKEEKSYFDIMISELDRANSIITEFLSLSRKEQPQNTIDNLNRIICRLRPLIEAQALKIDREVVFELEDVPDMPLFEKEICQLILNLVQNALEASPVNGVVRVHTYLEEKNAVFAVKDQGEGIDPAVIQHLWMPFYTTKENGTGLGLAICDSIVKRHRGRIDVETGSGGTTFLVNLPLAVPENEIECLNQLISQNVSC